jgi:phosphonate transport system permease protein
MGEYIPDYGITPSTPEQPPTGRESWEKEPEPERSPLIAGILSAVLPGAGHIYAGKIVRGIGFLLLFAMMVGLIFWTRSTTEFAPFPGLEIGLIILTVLFWLWTLASAVFTARRSRFTPGLGLIIVLVYTYLLGWQATEVNLRKFFTEFPDTFRIFTRVMWPWEAAFERDQEIDVVQTPFVVPCHEGELPEQVEGDGSAPWIVVEPVCGDFAEYDLQTQSVALGTELTVRGAGFVPNTEVAIWWRDPIGQEFRPLDPATRETPVVVTDADGAFTITFNAPQYLTPAEAEAINLHRLQARQVVAEGPVQVSEDFGLAIGRMIVTIFQALMATTFGIVLAIPVSFLAARNLMWHSALTRTIYYAVRFIMNVTRSIEPIIWAVIAAVWVGLGPFAGVIALTIHTIAALGKLYSEAIESIDPGPIEAVTATGANRLQMIMYAIIPQVIPPFLSFTIYRWDINVRMSTIIGFVGGGGIGQILFQWINQSLWSQAGMAVWLIALTVSIMDYGSAELRKRFI